MYPLWCPLVKKAGRESWLWLFVIANYQMSASVSFCQESFAFLNQLPCNHIMQEWDQNFQVVSLWTGGCHMSSDDFTHLPTWTRRRDLTLQSLNKTLQTWLVWMHSAISALCQQFAIFGHTLCVKASCLFRFGLEMNLTYPSSLCMVCSDRGRALCEIEVGSWQYPALSVLLSV